MPPASPSTSRIVQTQPVAPPVSWQCQAQADDVDVHAASQPNWSLNYEQLSRGKFEGSIHLVQLPGMRLVREQANCGTRQRGHIGIGQIGFAMPVAPQGPQLFHGRPLDDQSIMIGRSEALDLCIPNGYSLIAVVVDTELLRSVWERMYQKPLSVWLSRQLVVKVRPGMAEEVHKLHSKILRAIAEDPALLQSEASVLQLRDELLFEWIEAIPERVDSSDEDVIESRRRVVSRACDLVLAKPDDPPSMLELCGRIGASPRKLEYSFRSVLGISPSRYLRTVRLNGARRDLKRGSSSGLGVQDIAARWGFWHVGEFALEYRRQFSELPSATLGSARRSK